MNLTIKNWKIQDMQALLDWMITAKDWEYIIVKEKTKRTIKQNSYLRGCVYKTIADHMWETDLEYIHYVMWIEFLLDRTKKKPYPRSTTTLSTAEFTNYVESIKNLVSQYWVVIPSAEEYEQSL